MVPVAASPPSFSAAGFSSPAASPEGASAVASPSVLASSSGLGASSSGLAASSALGDSSASSVFPGPSSPVSVLGASSAGAASVAAASAGIDPPPSSLGLSSDFAASSVLDASSDLSPSSVFGDASASLGLSSDLAASSVPAVVVVSSFGLSSDVVPAASSGFAASSVLEESSAGVSFAGSASFALASPVSAFWLSPSAGLASSLGASCVVVVVVVSPLPLSAAGSAPSDFCASESHGGTKRFHAADSEVGWREEERTGGGAPCGQDHIIYIVVSGGRAQERSAEAMLDKQTRQHGQRYMPGPDTWLHLPDRDTRPEIHA